MHGKKFPPIISLLILLSSCANTYDLVPPSLQPTLSRKFNAYGHRFGGKVRLKNGTVLLFNRITLEGFQLKLYHL